MRLLLGGLAVTLLAATVASGVRAADQATDYRRSMGNLRPEANTAGRAIQGSTPYRAPSRSRVYAPSPVYPYGSGYVPYGSGYGYYPPYQGYYPTYRGYPRGYYRGYLYPPPIYLPAERLYGPQAVKRFMGVAP